MKALISVLFLLTTTSALAGELDGRWTGQINISSTKFAQAEPAVAEARVVVTQTADSLNIWHCWWVFNPDPNGNCVEMDYKVNAQGEIYSGDRKVGDVYSQRIVIMDQNVTAAEQMVISKNEEGQLVFTHSFMTQSGQSAYRRAVLKLEP